MNRIAENPEACSRRAMSSRRCAAVLLSIWIGFCAMTELSAHYFFPKISRIRHRVQEEEKNALGLRADSTAPAVLFVGNSLTEKGVDIPLMRLEMPAYKVSRFVVSDTSYLDWYYGLRRLFESGAHPQTVVLGLNASQLVSHRMEGALGANVLIRTADVAAAGRDLGLNNTSLSNLYFENLSAFYGGSTQFRKWLLGKLLPDIDSLGALLRPSTAAAPDSSFIETEATGRLRALNELCSQHGVRIVLVIPPTPDKRSDAAVEAVERAGKSAGVPVLVPVRPGEMSAEFFSDGFHLNQAGALRFTGLLSGTLKQRMPDVLNARR